MTTELSNNPGEGESQAQELDVTVTATSDDNQEVETEGQETQTETDDTDEIEHEGVKHRIPKALKGAFLMQADYTRKTQEVADLRRGVEERERTFGEQAKLQQEFLRDFGTLTALDSAISQYRQTDWNTLRMTNPDIFQQRWLEYQQLKDARDTAASELQSKVTKRQTDIAAETAKRQNDLRASLARDIPGYSPELANKMTDFGAREFGFTPQEIAGATDPRLHRVLHLAMIGKEAISKAAKTAAAAKTAQAAEAAKPPAQVGNRAISTKISASSVASDKLSGPEWLKRRNEELRAASR